MDGSVEGRHVPAMSKWARRVMVRDVSERSNEATHIDRSHGRDSRYAAEMRCYPNWHTDESDFYRS